MGFLKLCFSCHAQSCEFYTFTTAQPIPICLQEKFCEASASISRILSSDPPGINQVCVAQLARGPARKMRTNYIGGMCETAMHHRSPQMRSSLGYEATIQTSIYGSNPFRNFTSLVNGGPVQKLNPVQLSKYPNMQSPNIT